MNMIRKTVPNTGSYDAVRTALAGSARGEPGRRVSGVVFRTV